MSSGSGGGESKTKLVTICAFRKPGIKAIKSIIRNAGIVPVTAESSSSQGFASMREIENQTAERPVASRNFALTGMYQARGRVCVSNFLSGTASTEGTGEPVKLNSFVFSRLEVVMELPITAINVPVTQCGKSRGIFFMT